MAGIAVLVAVGGITTVVTKPVWALGHVEVGREVHDYLYWDQTCTRAQADQIFLLAMIENGVDSAHRLALHGAVSIAGGFAWDENARDRAKGLIRILPPAFQNVKADQLWPSYRLQLAAAGVAEPGHAPVNPAFCGRGDMSTDEALSRP